MSSYSATNGGGFKCVVAAQQNFDGAINRGMTMNAWTGFVTVLCVIVLIWLTLRIHAAAEQRRRSRQKPSPDGDAPENIHYAFSGNDLWGRLPSGDHSAHRHSGHSDGSHGSGSADSGGGGGADGGGDGGGSF